MERPCAPNLLIGWYLGNEVKYASRKFIAHSFTLERKVIFLLSTREMSYKVTRFRDRVEGFESASPEYLQLTTFLRHCNRLNYPIITYSAISPDFGNEVTYVYARLENS